MTKETNVELKIAKLDDVYTIQDIVKYFESRDIYYDILENVSVKDEDGEILVNPETKEPIQVKRLILQSIPTVQILLDKVMTNVSATDEDNVYHIVVVTDGDKMFPVSLDSLYEAVRVSYEDMMRPYFLVDASFAVPKESGYYMTVWGNRVRSLYYDNKTKTWHRSKTYRSSEDVLHASYWLIPRWVLKTADVLTDADGRMYMRATVEDDYTRMERFNWPLQSNDD